MSLFDPFHALMEQLNRTSDFAEALRALTDLIVSQLGFGLAGVMISRPDGCLEFLNLSGADDQLVAHLSSGTTPIAPLIDPGLRVETVGQWRFVPHTELRDLPGPRYSSRGQVPDSADAWHPDDLLMALLTDASGKVIGLMQVDEPPGGLRPSPGLMKILDICAIHGAAILRAHRQQERLRREVRFAALAHRITSLATSTMSIEKLTQQSVDMINAEFGCQRTAIRVIGSDRWNELWSTAPDPSYRAVDNQARELVARLAEEAWRDQRTRVVDVGRLEEIPSILPGEREVLRSTLTSRGTATGMIAPLGAMGELLGYLVFSRPPGADPWDDLECRFALTIANDVASLVLNARLNLTERRYSESMRELARHRQEMVATISHEFLGPISAIVGHAELLSDAADRADAHDPATSLAAIERSAERLAAMVHELLESEPYRADAGLAGAPRTDLVVAIADAVDAWREPARDRGIVIRVAHEGPVQVQGAPADVSHVVGNLLSNAVKYSPDRGEIMLELVLTESRVDFRCHNSGSGIPEEDQRRLFDRFFRGSRARADGVPGVGLGLTIVRRIMTDLGGAVSVESVPGDTVFTAHFRRAVPEPPGSEVPTRG